jgi:voltage-gated potassium channel
MAEPERPAVAPRRLRELQRIDARRKLARAVLRAILTTVVLLVLYYQLPVIATSAAEVTVSIVVGLVIVLGVVGMEIRAVYRAELPQLRAIIALAVSVTTMVIVFAVLYLNLAARDASSFTEPIDRTDSLYFTITTLATVGFGDIAAKTSEARIAVMVQMVFDVAVLGFAVKLIAGTMRSRLSSGSGDGA